MQAQNFTLLGLKKVWASGPSLANYEIDGGHFGNLILMMGAHGWLVWFVLCPFPSPSEIVEGTLGERIFKSLFAYPKMQNKYFCSITIILSQTKKFFFF